MAAKRPHRTVPQETKLARLALSDPHRYSRALAATRAAERAAAEQDLRLAQMMPRAKRNIKKGY